MPLITLFAFIFLVASILSLWIWRDPKIWGTLLSLSILCGFVSGNISQTGLVFIAILVLLWILYNRKQTLSLFILLVGIGTAFKLRFFPGYTPYFFTPKFAVGLEMPFIGLLPLALLVPLARRKKDWTAAINGLLLGCVGISILSVLATVSGVTQWNFKLPTFASERLLSNLLLTCIPEEGFYRGFIQGTLCKYFKNVKLGKTFALILTSILFTAVHLYWSPDIATLGFVFLASLLYGGVYLISKRIESAILCHFLVNFIHMTFFSYHAM